LEFVGWWFGRGFTYEENQTRGKFQEAREAVPGLQPGNELGYLETNGQSQEIFGEGEKAWTTLKSQNGSRKNIRPKT
jgi:hypothetical protein